MWILGKMLSGFGSKGPILLVVALVAGMACPPLAWSGYQLLPLSAFLLTLGSFLTASLAPADAGVRRSLVVVTLIWVGVGLPVAAALMLATVPLNASLRAGMLLSLLAPPVGSAAAIAAMLGLQPRLALLISITLTLLSPLSIPAFASLLDLGVQFDMSALTLRLFGIIGSAALVAFLMGRFRPRFIAVLPDQRAATGIAVIGLMIVGLATSRGIHAQWTSNPVMFAKMLTAAVGINFGLCCASALLFSKLGVELAGTIGIVSGNRNVTLAWAAASFGLPPLAEAYVAACVVPVLALPLIVKLGLAVSGAISRPGAARKRKFNLLLRP